jgi:hypothetical protein
MLCKFSTDLQSREFQFNELVFGTVNNKADNFVTFGNAVLRFKSIKYLRA